MHYSKVCIISVKAIVVLMIVSLNCGQPAAAIRILGLFPHPAISHFRFFQPILRGLADAGHDVTVVGLFKHDNPPPNYHDVTIPGEILTNAIGLQDDWFMNRRKFGHYYEMKFAYEWGSDACRNAYNSEGLQKIIKAKEKYDVILMEQFNADCLMGVAWHLKAPVIALSSCALMPWHYDRVGNPHIPSFVPSLFRSNSENMNFAQRFFNYIDIHLLNFLYSAITDPYTNELLRDQFGENVPPISQLRKQTSLMFVNQHYSLSGPKPLSPAVIELGGIHISQSKPIDPTIKEFLDNATEGVVFASWGSMVRTNSLPNDKRDAMVQAFGALKQRVLWKWENDTVPNKPNNVLIRKWVQQRDILCHPNVKVFVTHGGLMGSSEAAYCGVPVVATPMYGDQFLNAAAFINRGMGAVVHYEDITKENFVAAIDTVLSPQAFANAKKVAYAFKNRIQTPLETAIWWVEHVAATRGAPLSKAHSVYMGAVAYHSWDVIAVLAFLLIALVAAWVWLLKQCFCGKTKETLREKRKTKLN